MYCTAGIGGGVEPILKAAREASTIVALDGCPLDCTKRSLENAGFTEFRHLRVTDMGFLKGKTETAESNVAAVAEAVRTAIAD